MRQNVWKMWFSNNLLWFCKLYYCYVVASVIVISKLKIIHMTTKKYLQMATINKRAGDEDDMMVCLINILSISTFIMF